MKNNKIYTPLFIIYVFLTTIFFSSCATMFTKKNTKIKFDGSELAAEVLVKNSKDTKDFQKVGNTPFEALINNRGKNQVRYVFSDGTMYDFELKKKFNGLTILNIFNYGIGIPIDLISGRFLKPKYKFYFVDKKNDKIELFNTKKRNTRNNKKGGQNNWLLDRDYFRPSIALTYAKQDYGKFNTLFNYSKDSINSSPYFTHEIPIKIVGNESRDINDLTFELSEKKVANELIKAWWYDGKIDKWTFDRYEDRCIFNATDSKYLNALKTNRGTQSLQDQGLLNETYFTNTILGKIYTYEEWYDKIDEERAYYRSTTLIFGRLFFPKVKRKKTGYVIEDSKMSVFKLKYDDEVVNMVTKKYVLSSSKSKVKDFYKEKFILKYLSTVSASKISGGVSKRKNNRKKRKGKDYYTEQELFTMCLQNNNLALNEEIKYEIPNFNVHAGVFESTRNFAPFINPLGVKIKIGKKEHLHSDTKYAVYRKKLKKDGTTKWVYAGGIISTNKICDNTTRSITSVNLSKFRQISGIKKVQPGMMIEELPDKGWSFNYSLRYPQKDSITNTFHEFRFERNVSKRINRRTKFNGNQKKFPVGVRFFFEYLRGSSDQLNYGIRGGTGDENLLDYSALDFTSYKDSTVSSAKNKVDGFDKYGIVGKTINIKRNAFNVGLSKEISFYTFISIHPYLSFGLDFENVKKNNKIKGFVFHEKFETEKMDITGLYSTSASFSYGARIMAALNLRFHLVGSFNTTHFATLRYFDLNYSRSKNSFSLGLNWSF